MDVKIDPKILRQHRDARAWSQEQLAEAAGLSVRTVQRVEADGRASPETRQALAGALGMDLASLSPPQASQVELLAPAPPSAPPEAPAGEGLRHRREPGGFRRHLTVYLAMALLFVILDVYRDGHLNWAGWPILGWGIGVLKHYVASRPRPAVGA